MIHEPMCDAPPCPFCSNPLHRTLRTGIEVKDDGAAWKGPHDTSEPGDVMLCGNCCTPLKVLGERRCEVIWPREIAGWPDSVREELLQARGLVFRSQRTPTELRPFGGTVNYETKTPTLAVEAHEDLINWLLHRPNDIVTASTRLHIPWVVDRGLAQDVVFLWTPTVLAARIVLWDTDIWDGATAGRAAFDGETLERHDMPMWPEVWHFTKPFSLDAKTCARIGVAPTRNVESYLLWPAGDSLAFAAVFQPDTRGDGEPFNPGYHAPAIHHLGTVNVGDSVDRDTAHILAGRRFMDLPFVENRTEQPNHTTRKTYKRAGREAPALSVIHLRKREASQALAEHGSREYHCHFLVGAHWRKPTERMKEPRPVYVSPYVKGDKSKPFKAPGQTVFKVVR